METVLSVQNNLNFNGNFYDIFLKKLPNKELNNAVKYNKLGHTLASPHWNRLALGIAAISTQPAIDYFNPRVDRDTATSSALRTLAKIIVCTTVGFAVRGGTYKLVEKYAHAFPKEGSTIFTPKEILNEKNITTKMEKLKLHKNALSTVSALCVMIFTNIFLDAPLTTIAANKLINEFKKKQNNKKMRMQQ